jgi:formylglycine-generating enzyme required for sulfatase activity
VRARPARAAVGRADLLRLAAGLSPEGLATAAASLGFREKAVEPEAVRAVPAASPEPVPKVDVPEPAEGEPMRFWRMEEMTFFDDAPPEPPARAVVAPAPPLSDDDLGGPGSLFAVPRAPPLATWRRLWPAVREALHGFVPGHDPDVPALVRAWGRGEVVGRLPRVVRRTWAARASLWLDRSARLVPFWSDQLGVWRRLRAACGRTAIEVRWLDARAQARAMRRGGDMIAGRVDPETPVLVLGDLGTYGSDADRRAWQRTARRLDRAGVRAAALIPAPPARWERDVARRWCAFSWEDGRRGAPRAVRPDLAFWRARAERLLRLVSPAALVQPGLLRALRLLLPAHESDAAAEADARAHRDVRAADTTGLVLQPEAAVRLREQFATHETAAVKEAVSAAIRGWHEGLPRQLLRAETLAWLDEAAPPGDREDALDLVARMVTSARLAAGGKVDPSRAAAVRMLERKTLLSMPREAYEKIPGLDLVWVSAFEGIAGVRVPEGVDATRLAAELKPGAPRWWAVRQVGVRLELAESPGPAWPSHVEGPGSPVAWLLAGGPALRVGERLVPLEAGPLPVSADEVVKLRTDKCAVTVGVWETEAWAIAAGRDRFGLWADFEAKGVLQRFRWIPPGRCVVGSPEGEAGRSLDEGPQHLVTWTRGRWLADTPVTQALWKVITGRNPSRFKSAERPVEQVDWTQSKAFAKEVGARLPSEAEWEYACRAGTTTATWRGNLVIVGLNDAPLLDDIAWYGGNCGIEFELDDAWSTAEWSEKQHEFVKGGTHPVRHKESNPFGLFDMLGNVFEWCEDAIEHSRGYKGADVTDPRPLSAGPVRVYRGGSGRSVAKAVRAAERSSGPRENRYDRLGLRLAREQPSPAAEPGVGAEPQSAGKQSRPAPKRHKKKPRRKR